MKWRMSFWYFFSLELLNCEEYFLYDLENKEEKDF